MGMSLHSRAPRFRGQSSTSSGRIARADRSIGKRNTWYRPHGVLSQGMVSTTFAVLRPAGQRSSSSAGARHLASNSAISFSDRR